MLQNHCDIHTHTLYSRHAYSTVRENVLAARDAGLELLGIADHFSDMLFPGQARRRPACVTTSTSSTCACGRAPGRA